MSGITKVASTQLAMAGTTTLTVPTGVTSSHLGIILAADGNSYTDTSTLSLPAGWTKQADHPSAANNSAVYVWTKLGGYTAGQTITVTQSDTSTWEVYAVWYDTAGNDVAVVGTVGGRSGTSSANTVIPGITTTLANQDLIIVATERSTAVGTAVSSYTGFTPTQDFFAEDTNTSSSGYFGHYTKATAGATGNLTITYNGGSGNGAGMMFAVAQSTLRSAVINDSPSVFYYLDEGSGAFANHGSLGGSSTNTGNITYSQTAPTAVGMGTAVKFNPTAITNATIGGGTLVSGTTWTYETWVKRDTMTNPWVRVIGNILNGTSTSGTNYAEIAIIDDSATAVTGSVRLWDNTSGTSVSFTHSTIGDLNWHHVAVVWNNGTATLYVDGVSLGSGSMTCASKTGNLLVGTKSVVGTAYLLDETAFFTTALSGTRIAAHAGASTSPNVTVTPPAMSMTNLTTVTPVVSGQTNLTVAPPAMSFTSLTVPVPPVVYGGTGVSNSAPAMTLSVDSVTPAVSTTSTVFYANANADRGTSTDANLYRSADRIPMADSTFGTGNKFMLVNFGSASIPAGYSVSSATLVVSYVMESGVTPNTNRGISIYKASIPWTEAGTESPSEVTIGTGNITKFPASAPNTGTFSVDITQALNSDGTLPANGFIIESRGGVNSSNTFDLYTHEATDSTLRPYVKFQTVPAAVVSAPPATLDLSTVAPVVSETSNDTLTVPAMTMDLSVPGGTPALPDYLAQPLPMTLGLSSPDATVSVQYPTIASAPAIDAGTLDMATAPTINLTTNRLTVAPVMTLSLKWVGIYVEDADRYLTITEENVLGKDIWLKLNDNIGATSAADSAADSSGAFTAPQNVSFNGRVTQRVDGPFLRKAVNFNGVDAYLGTFGARNAADGAENGSPYFYSSEPSFDPNASQLGGLYTYDPQEDLNYVTDMPLTVEFSLRTTDLDGVIWTGWQTAGFQNNSITFPSGYEVRLEGGYIHFVKADNDGNIQYDQKVRTFISDGQWHHIVIAFPTNNAAALDKMKGNFYVLIDGHPAYVREGVGPLSSGPAYQWAPWAFMGRPAWKKPTNLFNSNLITTPQDLFSTTVPTNCLAGDLSEVIVRPRTYLPMDTAQTIYYEWSNATIVKPEPMTVSLSVNPPFKAKGNVKKMLALYGLPFVMGHGAPAVGQPGQALYQYLDVLSGMVIKNLGGSTNTQHNSFTHSSIYAAPESFYIEDFFVVPVSIFGNLNNDDAYAMSTPGTLNQDVSVTTNGIYVNDETGHPRFINLQEDLSADVTEEYDVITVVNYPWENPNDPGVGEYNYITPYHGFGNMTNEQWEQARDDLRDSIMEAVYDGCSMWIGDYYVAYHLGFIQGYDIHNFGRFDVTGKNTHAEDIDNAHLDVSNKSTLIESGHGDYYTYPQANYYRRITALVPDLTDMPGNDYAQYVEAWNIDAFQPNGNFVAYDILRRPNGLQLGDQLSIEKIFTGSKFFGENDATTELSYPDARVAITSAHPDGICGTVVSREQESYYGPNGVVVQNPYKDNALTIAAEQGTVVNGRPIGGRVFIELMGSGTFTRGYIGEDTNKKLWKGNPTPTQISQWDFDARRQLELKNSTTITKWHFDKNSGDYAEETITQYFFVYSDTFLTMNLYLPMAYRGLHWLSLTPTSEPGQEKVLVPAMTLNLTTPDATLDKTSSPATQVSGAMRLNLDLRQPANYADGNVEEDVFGAMEMSLELRGLGRLVQVPPMSLTVTTPDPTLRVAADTITVYLDEDRNITLFLKEDN